jgi:hypothetical protein
MSWFNSRTKEALLQSKKRFDISPQPSLAIARYGLSVDMFRRFLPVHIDRCRKTHSAVNSAQKKCRFTRRDDESYPQNNWKKVASNQALTMQEMIRLSNCCIFSTSFVEKTRLLAPPGPDSPRQNNKFRRQQSGAFYLCPIEGCSCISPCCLGSN